MQKRFFIIHGWEGSPEGNWFPWLKDMLQKKGFEVHAPHMPDPSMPKEGRWVDKLVEEVGYPDSEVYLIGHSLGSIAILRYLEQLKSGKEVGGCLLVAGFTEDIGIDQISDFFKKPINWDTINSHCRKFVAIASNNDQYVALKYADILQEKLGARKIIEPGMGHFQTKELHVALNEILKMASPG
ncbi:MAG: serine hydrolase family protein [Candidatus Micrarchaeota archaeon]|nr:serine hydrolase family protein [Candidatus Micrarchaeota archaeon]MDE1833742.1 serine hydrolase family protein [Candidatus Micrarchaeota archaeon]MDE1859433.1 serine hydrolase family protein [Candidatus Micrarchaeota archaeon]